MKNTIKLFVIFSAALSACSSTHAPVANQIVSAASPVVQKAEMIKPIDLFLQYYDTVSSLPGPALYAEYQKADSDLSRSGSDLDRIKAGMLLALPNTSFRDTKTAINLLNTAVIKDTGLKSMAGILKAVLMQEQQSENAMRDMAQMLKDERKRSESLQGKIDAIKTMEKSFILRDKQ
jgi:hypothetical protein